MELIQPAELGAPSFIFAKPSRSPAGTPFQSKFCATSPLEMAPQEPRRPKCSTIERFSASSGTPTDSVVQRLARDRFQASFLGRNYE